MKSLLIIGAGSHRYVAAETAELCGYEKIDFLDDNALEAIGNTGQLLEFSHSYDGVIVSIGNCDMREHLINRLKALDAPLVSLVHPKAVVSHSARIGSGSIVLLGAVIHTNAEIGIGCIISIGALIDHNAVVDNFSHINTGAIIGAGRRIGGKVLAGEVIR